MKKNKNKIINLFSFTFIFSLLAISLESFFIVTSNQYNNDYSRAEGDELYSLDLTDNLGLYDNTFATISSIGNYIDFSTSNVTVTNTYPFVVSQNGYIVNDDAVSGLNSFTINYSGSGFIHYQYSENGTNYSYSHAVSTRGSSVSITIPASNYLKLTAVGGACNITNLSYNYSCSPASYDTNPQDIDITTSSGTYYLDPITSRGESNNVTIAFNVFPSNANRNLVAFKVADSSYSSYVSISGNVITFLKVIDNIVIRAYSTVNNSIYDDVSFRVTTHFIYNLTFSDSSNYLKNTATSADNYASATEVGTVTHSTTGGPQIPTSSGYSELGYAKLSSDLTTNKQIKIPWEVANNSELTIAFWLNAPANDSQYYRHCFAIFGDSNNFFDYQLKHPYYWDGCKEIIYQGGTDYSPAPADNTGTRCATTGGLNFPESGTMSSTYGAWSHFAITFSSSEINVYQNGSLVNTTEAADVGLEDMSPKYYYDSSNNGDFIIGSSNWVDDYNSNSSFADIRVYDVVLGASDIENITSQYYSIANNNNYDMHKDPFITSRYEFESYSWADSIKKDTSGSYLTSTGNGDVTMKDGYVELGNSGSAEPRSSISLSPFTALGSHELSFAIRLCSTVSTSSATSGWRPLFELTAGATGPFLIVYQEFNNNNIITIKYVLEDHVTEGYVDSDICMEPYAWYTIVVTMSENGVKLYIANKLYGTISLPYTNSIFPYTWASNMTFGGSIYHDKTNDFAGRVAFIRFWSTELSEADAKYVSNVWA